jgi:hypothetical protein
VANLSKAELYRTNILGANLSGTDLSEAESFGAYIGWAGALRWSLPRGLFFGIPLAFIGWFGIEMFSGILAVIYLALTVVGLASRFIRFWTSE